MGKVYLYSTKRELKNVIIIHIYGAIFISLLFCDNQDIEYESQEIYISVSQAIFCYCQDTESE